MVNSDVFNFDLGLAIGSVSSDNFNLSFVVLPADDDLSGLKADNAWLVVI